MKDKEIIWKTWRDAKTGINGFLSIFGSGITKASGGGIRVSPTITSEITKQIARIMRNKFFLTGAGDIKTGEPIDGAGIGICARPEEVTPNLLMRFMKDLNFIKLGVGAAASTGISTKGVCEALNIVHLQEPIARAIHTYSVRPHQIGKESLEQARKSLIMTGELINKPLSLRHFAPTNLVTGLAAAEIVNKFFVKLSGKRIGMVGFGAAGGSFAFRATELGAKIVFIANSEGVVTLNDSKKEIPLLLKKIRRGVAPVPRLHLKDFCQPLTLKEALRQIKCDIIILACTEGVINKRTVLAIPQNMTIVSIANIPWMTDAQKLVQKRFDIFPAALINLGNATLFSLACLGCRAKNPNDLLDRTIKASLAIVRLAIKNSASKRYPIWNEVVPEFI